MYEFEAPDFERDYPLKTANKGMRACFYIDLFKIDSFRLPLDPFLAFVLDELELVLSQLSLNSW